MELCDLDKELRQLNRYEEELKNLDRRDMKLYFSKAANDSNWRINNEKLMTDHEEIAIHKHDRFIDFDQHSHDYLEMIFVYSGEVHHRIQDESICLKRGEILLLDMNVEHSIEAASENDIAVNILIKREFFDTFFLKQIAYNNLISNFVVNAIYSQNNARQYMYFQSDDNQVIWNLCINILMEYYDHRNGMETAIRAYMLLLFNELFRDYQKFLTKQVVKRIDDAIILDLKTYIDDNYKTLSLKKMANYFNYNSDYLGKQIKKLTGMNLRELVKVRKLEEAARLLKYSDLTILEILEEIKYSNASYFYKQFKKRYGVKPDEYRQMKQK